MRLFRLQDMVREFLRVAKAKNLSPNTLSYYQSALGKFVAFLEREGLPLSPESMSPASMRRYMEHMAEEEHLSPGGMHARLRALRAFASFLVEEGILEQSPFRRVKLPKVPQQALPVVGPEEFAALMHHAALGRNPLRDQAILATLFDTGLRARELLGLRLEDIGQGVLRVRGKGGKDRHVPVSKSTLRLLRRYIQAERPASPLPFVFLAEAEAPLSYAGLRRVFSRLFERAGLPYKSAHSFRRGFAVAYLRNGGDVFTLQRILGHSTLDMSRRYAQLTMEDVCEVHLRASPVLRARYRDAEG